MYRYLTKQQLTALSNIAKAILCIALLVFFYFTAKRGGDFSVYMAAANALFHHQNCYNTWFTYQGNNIGVQYSYSPVFAFILAPLSQLPAIVTIFIYLLSFPFIIYRIFKLAMIQLGIYQLPANARMMWIGLVSISVVRFVLHNVEMVQMNLFLLYLCMEGLYQITQKERKLNGSILIALGCIIKILPIVFIPYLVYRKEIKAASLIVIWLLLAALIPVPFLGLAFTKQLFIDWWQIINPLRPEYTYLADTYGGVGVQSLASFISVYFSASNHEGFSATIFNLNQHCINIIILLSQSFLVLLTLYFLNSPPFRAAKNITALFYEQAYIFAITALTFPHQQKYAFIYIFPAYAFIYAVIVMKIERKERINIFTLVLLILAFCLLTLTTDGLIGWKFSLLFQYMKFITVGVFILILLLAIYKKEIVRMIKQGT